MTGSYSPYGVIPSNQRRVLAFYFQVLFWIFRRVFHKIRSINAGVLTPAGSTSAYALYDPSGATPTFVDNVFTSIFIESAMSFLGGLVAEIH